MASRAVPRRVGTAGEPEAAISRRVSEQHGRDERAEGFDEELHLHDWFDECFYSNEIVGRKPDPAAYLHVSKALKQTPTRTRSRSSTTASTCVNGAIAVGMHGHHVTGFGELQIRLTELGILTGRNAISVGGGRNSGR